MSDRPDAGQPSTADEIRRLNALARYVVVDTPSERSFDDLTRLAARFCDAPTGLITFVDETRQFFKARVGFGGDATSPLDAGFCPVVVRAAAPVVIEDAAADPAHRDNPAVRDGGVRFYAGVPLLTPDGHVLGTLCVLDTSPRPGGLTEPQQDVLQTLSRQVMNLLELRRETAEHRRSEARLRALNDDLEKAVRRRVLDRGRIWQVTPDLLVVIGSGGHFEACNPAWTAVLGWSEAELCDAPFATFVHPDDQEATETVWRAAIDEDVPALRFQNRYRHKDGSWRWLSWVAVLDGDKVFGSARDITAERAQTAALGERTEELRLHRDIVQSDAAPILAFDRHYAVTAFNRAHDREFQRVMGRRQGVGDVLPELFPPDQAEALKGLMDRALAGERFSVIQSFGDPGREMPTWDITYSPLLDPDGRVIGAFHHARDISERVQAEGELFAAHEALRQAQKMEAVGQLTGGVAHDFNNLLTVIRSSSELLKRPGLSEERRSRYVEAISVTVDRAAKLTGQLLAFARRQALKPVVFDANESVRALFDMMRTLTGSRIKVTTRLDEASCYVNADPSQFDTALVNLAVNARDAMGGEGHITISVQAVETMAAIRSHPVIDGPYVMVAVTDTGAGIPADTIERIFEPFFTTKEIGKGTGLGLSQVFGFVKQSGGQVTVDSSPGQGATFTFYLPRVAAPSDGQATGESEPFVDGHGTRVLVVEDNADVGTFAVQCLTDLGYATTFAANGSAALVELSRGADRFDVVFSDVMMPGINGIELGQEIRRLYPDLPVVLTSGYSHVLAQNGTYGFELLHKPYSIEQLSQVLRKVATWQRRTRLLDR